MRESGSNDEAPPRVLIVAEHASARFGGEAALPLHYFRVLRNRGIPAWLVTHERTRTELEALFPSDHSRILCVRDTLWHRLLWRLSRWLPSRVSGFTTGFLMRLITQFAQRRVIRKLVADQGISVIHQPIPVSPREPSMIYDVGAPVIFGPMNGGMDYPAAFRDMQSRLEWLSVLIGRRLSGVLNWLLPGKRKAAVLLVANERTLNALPRGVCECVEILVENGVDLTLWEPVCRTPSSLSPAVTRYVYLGRLVDWKAVDMLLLAFRRASNTCPITLAIIGDGVERSRLEQMAQSLGVLGDGSANDSGKVVFWGWLSQSACAERLRQSDALVLPSLLECGGAVVLEAMAMQLPVIATAWGGPADYLDSSCGILVEPTSKERFVEGLASAMATLADHPEKRVEMGKAGRSRVAQNFDWEIKVDRMLATYRRVAAEWSKGPHRPTPVD